MAESAGTVAAADEADAAEPSFVDRMRGYLPWIAGGILLFALFATMKWWGDQQQRAALRGRAWPPEPVKVFLRG